MTKLAFLDLDGTVADDSPRRHFIESEPPQWGKYLNGDIMLNDGVLFEGLALYQQYVEEEREIIFITGRPERTRQQTLAWLFQKGFMQGPHQLTMRQNQRMSQIDLKLHQLESYVHEIEAAEQVDVHDDNAGVVTSANDRFKDLPHFKAHLVPWAQVLHTD